VLTTVDDCTVVFAGSVVMITIVLVCVTVADARDVEVLEATVTVAYWDIVLEIYAVVVVVPVAVGSVSVTIRVAVCVDVTTLTCVVVTLLTVVYNVTVEALVE